MVSPFCGRLLERRRFPLEIRLVRIAPGQCLEVRQALPRGLVQAFDGILEPRAFLRRPVPAGRFRAGCLAGFFVRSCRSGRLCGRTVADPGEATDR